MKITEEMRRAAGDAVARSYTDAPTAADLGPEEATMVQREANATLEAAMKVGPVDHDDGAIGALEEALSETVAIPDVVAKDAILALAEAGWVLVEKGGAE